MKLYKKGSHPEPNPKDTAKLKEFMKMVYEQKRFYEDEDDEKEKKKKKKKQKKKEVSDPEDEEVDDKEEIKKVAQTPKEKKTSITPADKREEKKVSAALIDVLDFDSGPTVPAPVEKSDSDWANFSVSKPAVSEEKKASVTQPLTITPPKQEPINTKPTLPLTTPPMFPPAGMSSVFPTSKVSISNA